MGSAFVIDGIARFHLFLSVEGYSQGCLIHRVANLRDEVVDGPEETAYV